MDCVPVRHDTSPFKIVSQGIAERNVPEPDCCGEAVESRHFLLNSEGKLVPFPRLLIHGIKNLVCRKSEMDQHQQPKERVEFLVE